MHNSNGKQIPWSVAVSPESDRYGSLSEIWVTLGASTAETSSRTKSRFRVGIPLALPLIDEGFDKSKNVTPDIGHGESSKQHKNGSLVQNHPLRANFQILLLRFNRGHWLTFLPALHADLPVTKKCEFFVPVTKTPTFHRHFASLWPRATKF